MKKAHEVLPTLRGSCDGEVLGRVSSNPQSPVLTGRLEVYSARVREASQNPSVFAMEDRNVTPKPQERVRARL